VAFNNYIIMIADCSFIIQKLSSMIINRKIVRCYKMLFQSQWTCIKCCYKWQL